MLVDGLMSLIPQESSAGKPIVPFFAMFLFFLYLRGLQVLSVVASQVKCVQDAVARLSNPDLRETQYQHLPAGTPNVKVLLLLYTIHNA